MVGGLDGAIFVGGGGEEYATKQGLLLKYANRHGLVAGATGTGKTVTLQILSEGFSKAGVPVFVSDVKGDLSGLAATMSADHKLHEPFQKRAGIIGFEDYAYEAFPVTFWDIYGEQGHPIRTTVSEMGPLLLSRLLELTDVQEGVLNIAFRVADEQGMPLLDLEDLQALLVWARTPRICRCAMATSPRPRSGRSSGRFWCSKTRAANGCSGNRRWNCPT